MCWKMGMPFLNTTASAENLTGNLSYLYLLYLITAPPFLLPTKPTMPEYFAVAGQLVSLPCRGLDSKPGDIPTLIRWFRDESPTPIYTLDARRKEINSATHFQSLEYSSRSFFNVSSHPPTLLIDPVLPSDGGVYKCQIEFKKSSTIHHSCRLCVIVPPKEVVITDQKGQRLQGVIGPYDENSDINLSCEAIGGDPPSRVTWWRGSKLLKENNEASSENNVKSHLSITNLQRRDLLATYTCYGSNNNMTLPKSSSVTIALNLKPLDVRIRTVQNHIYAETKTEIVCESYGGRPNAVLTWWLNGIKITTNYEENMFHNFTRNSLMFLPTPEDNGKTLSCTAVNPMFPKTVIEHKRKLVVFYLPRVELRFGPPIEPNLIREDTDVYLECIVDANPRHEHVRWYFEGNIFHTNLTVGILQSNQTLVLQNIQKQRTGRYTCETSNSIGATRSPEIMLRVRYVPTCQLTPSPISVEIGKNAMLACESDAYPVAVSFRWIFSDSENEDVIFQSLSDSSNISFTPTVQHINGMVSCWASNAVGEQLEPCTSKIYQAAPPSPMNECIVLNQTESSVRIECQPTENKGLTQSFHLEVYDSNLDHLILNRTTNQTPPSFVVPNVDSASSYIAVLYASNIKGRSSTVTVTANFSPLSRGRLLNPDTKHGDGRSIAARPIFFVPLTITFLILSVIFVIVFFHRRRQKSRKIRRQTNGELENSNQTRDAEAASNLEEHIALNDSNPDVVQNRPVSHNLSLEEKEGQVEIIYNFEKKKEPHSNKKKRIITFSFTKRKRRRKSASG